MKMSVLIIAAVFLQSATAFFGLNIRSRFATNVVLFKNEILLNETQIYSNTSTASTSSTDINDDYTLVTEFTPYLMNSDVIVEEIIITKEEPDKTLYIELTPEKYKEYYVAVSDRRNRIYDETNGESYV
jgi:hypothetical protein